MNSQELIVELRAGATVYERPRWMKGYRCELRKINGEILPVQRSTILAAIARADFPVVRREHLITRHCVYMHPQVEDRSDMRFIERWVFEPNKDRRALS